MTHKVVKNKAGIPVVIYRGIEYTHYCRYFNPAGEEGWIFYKIIGEEFNGSVPCIIETVSERNATHVAYVAVSRFEGAVLPLELPKPFFHSFKVDDKIMVKDTVRGEWRNRHFAGMSQSGLPSTYNSGTTSFSGDTEEVSYWYMAKHPETGEEWSHGG